MFDLVKSFDFSSLITKRDETLACRDIDAIIDAGMWGRSNPRFQTNANVFDEFNDKEWKEHWAKIAHTFYASCHMYAQKYLPMHSYRSWGMKTNASCEYRERWVLWHNHTDKNEKSLSGIYYLKIPDSYDLKTAGTEFVLRTREKAEEFKDAEPDFTVEPKLGHWHIWPSHLYHRPVVPHGEEWRYIVSADYVFDIDTSGFILNTEMPRWEI